VGHTAHGLRVGDKITFSGAAAVAGVDMNDTFTITSINNANSYSVESKTQASATSTLGGGSVTYSANSFNSLGTLASNTEVTVNAATGLNISYGELASQESFADLFETLNIFANVQVSAGANEAQKQANQVEYRTLVDNARTVVEQAFDDINRMVADLGGDLSRLESAKETHQNEIELITKQLDGVENIDSFEAINRFQSLRSQIEASYQITAASRGFSLLNFL
ncbi:MAG: flagellin, partial [Pseudomonadota bacterium]|nr:flagellin [Pseudomonadota bacterium]